MIVLNRKRISLILIIIIVGVFTFEYQIAKLESENVPVVSTPVSDKVIVIDAGHGTPDEGVSLLH